MSVPKLRFPEFLDAGEWEVKKLGEVATFYNGKAYKQEELLEQGKYRVLRVGNFFTSNNWYYSDLELDETKYCDYGDLLYAWSASFGPRVWQGEKVIYHYHIWKVVEKKNINKKFLFIVLEHETERLKDQSANGLGLLHITKGTIEGWECGFPTLPEQKKIADCLSSIDDRITAETQKLDTLKAHKKGLMQQLFPAEGETMPKLRFPEFRDSGEWVKQKVSKILVKVSNPVTVDQNETYYQIGIRSHGKGIFHKESINGDALGSKRVFWIEENAFIVNIVFAWELAVANTTVTEKGMIASHRFPMYKAYKNKANVIFIKYFFLTNKGKELLWIASPGGAGRNKTLGQKEFENLDLLIPKLVEEQQKIADCLTSIDEAIAAQSQAIDLLKLHKKGLMQQLFPTLDEVKK